MMDWIIKEAQWKAKVFQDTKHVVAFDAGVVKSDIAIGEDLRQVLKDAVRPLEDVPEGLKNYHPGSDDKVVDLVHPSLFPVVYGRTRILHRKLIGLEDFLNYVGEGKILAIPPEEEATATIDRDWGGVRRPYSRKFQWLPCDVHFTDNGECRIASYINNLHPNKHRQLYQVIEKILEQTIPLWNTTLTLVRDKYKRIPYNEVQYDEHPEPEPQPENEEDEHSDEYYQRYDEWQKREPIRRPEPGEFAPHVTEAKKQVNLHKDFAERGLQVIIKLANIELTPEKPEYEGGSWHVEGQLVCCFAGAHKHTHTHTHTDFHRMSISALQPSTTTTVRTSPTADSHSDNGRIQKKSHISPMTNRDTNSSTKSLAWIMRRVGTRAMSLNSSAGWTLVKDACSPSQTACSTRCRRLRWQIGPSQAIARSSLSSSWTPISRLFLQRMCHLNKRTGGRNGRRLSGSC